MSDITALDWRFIPTETRPGAIQMALDEVAARSVATGGQPTVRVYEWDPSTLTLGYTQDPETVEWDVCRQTGVDVTRRQTGGGGIYHDASGDISYSIVLPAEAVPGSLLASYELLCTPVLDALDVMGVDAAFADRPRAAVHQPACYLRAVDPAHDILAGGRKISGNAQYRQRDVVVQHGSLSFARHPDQHLGVFASDIDEESFMDRVTSIRAEAGIDRDRAVAMLEGTLRDWASATSGEWTPAELEATDRLVEEKYGAESWVREGDDPTDR